jgi:hypothetical protein
MKKFKPFAKTISSLYGLEEEIKHSEEAKKQFESDFKSEFARDAYYLKELNRKK